MIMVIYYFIKINVISYFFDKKRKSKLTITTKFEALTNVELQMEFMNHSVDEIVIGDDPYKT